VLANTFAARLFPTAVSRGNGMVLPWREAFDGMAAGVAYWQRTGSERPGMGMDREPLKRHERHGESGRTHGEVPIEATATAFGPDGAGGCVSLEAEVPEVLFDGMREFISCHPDWDQYSVITSALAGFLFQNGCSDQSVTQHYLDGLFQRP
jgi:hypothetical protein